MVFTQNTCKIFCANILELFYKSKRGCVALLQLEAHLIEMQDTSLVTSRLDAKIGKEEWRKSDMLAQINTLEAQAAKNFTIKMGLEKRVEQAHKEVDGKKKIIGKQTLQIMELQSENQSLENRVLEAIQLRDQRKRFGFGNHFRNRA